MGPVWRDAAFWAVRTGRHAQNHRGSLLPPTPCPAPGSKAFPCPLLFTNPPAGGQRRKPLVSTRRNKLQASQPWDWETGVQRYARGSGELFRSGQTTPSPWGGGGWDWLASPALRFLACEMGAPAPDSGAAQSRCARGQDAGFSCQRQLTRKPRVGGRNFSSIKSCCAPLPQKERK